MVPPNSVASVWSRAIFQCFTDSKNSLRWNYFPPGAKEKQMIYNGEQLNVTFLPRYTVNTSSTQKCDIIIKDVQLADAGLYRCDESRSTDAVEAQLIVIGINLKILVVICMVVL